ncbi:MAG: nuclease A inhibitor family protein [Myxococcales bacterium]|nr:nuclease A inhibitor family protein [Polyangiaceae bacterium]MDW8249013.1 nuclease A inhibitor family protein [Myxococcales bacterium]
MMAAIVATACTGDPFVLVAPEPAASDAPLTTSAPPLIPAPSLCGEALSDALTAASSGMLWPSETDAPLLPLLVPGADPADWGFLRELVGTDPSTPVMRHDLGELDALGLEHSWMTVEERAEAARFRALAAILRENLENPAIYRVGQENAHLLLVGRSRCSELAGLVTFVVET